jgi:SAM-dependent methyltransferase
MTRVWPPALVDFWRNYVPPCRPSRFDLDLGSSFLEEVRARNDRKPEVLILGSTNEFRDWAFEERCRVTVVDNSQQFHDRISQDRRHPSGSETFILRDWLDLTFQDRFDLVLGDLVVGNIWSPELPKFLSVIYNSLAPGGCFQTKSFFYNKESSTPVFADLVKDFSRKNGSRDPFPYFAYALTVHCRDPESGILDFSDMYDAISAEVINGRLPDWVLERYKELGWGDGSKIFFEVIDLQQWRNLLVARFDSNEERLGPYSWSQDFPVFTCFKS